MRTVLVLTLVAAIAAAAGTARADSTRITRGDATAIAQSMFGGAVAIRTNAPTLEGAPVQTQLGRIAPFVSGRHYCSLDWHVISLYFIEPELDHEATAAEAAAVVFNWTLDGAALATQDAGVKAAYPADWYFGSYAIVSPDALAVGTHTLSVVATDTRDGSIAFANTVTFTIDPADSGTCV